jgi:hypothetical protein
MSTKLPFPQVPWFQVLRTARTHSYNSACSSIVMHSSIGSVQTITRSQVSGPQRAEHGTKLTCPSQLPLHVRIHVELEF